MWKEYWCVCLFGCRKNCSPGSLFTADIRRFCPADYEPIKVCVYFEVYVTIWLYLSQFIPTLLPSLSLPLSPSLLPSLNPSPFPQSLLPSLSHSFTLCLPLSSSLSPPFVSLFLFLLRFHFYLFSSSFQHRSAHWNVKYEGVSTLFCGQMGTERERTLQMKLSKSALKVRGKEEGEESSFTVYVHLSPRQWVFLFCSEVSFPGSQGKILRDNYTVRHATLIVDL